MMNIIDHLRAAHTGAELFCTLWNGPAYLVSVNKNHIIVSSEKDLSVPQFSLALDGAFILGGLCQLWPSSTCRDWANYKTRFSPAQLKPFDRVLVRAKNSNKHCWMCDLFSHLSTQSGHPVCVGGRYPLCIPYNEATMSLVATTNEPPEHYVYWLENNEA